MLHILYSHGNDNRRYMLWRMKTYVPPTLKLPTCDKSQLVLKGRSGRAEPLQGLPHIPCLRLATLHISSQIIYILLFHPILSYFIIKQASCLPLSLFLWHFGEICLLFSQEF